MSLLLETIRLVERRLQALPYHQQRVERTMRQCFPQQSPILLSASIEIPEDLTHHVYKCRVLYDTQIRQVEYLPYTMQPVRSLALATISSSVDYSVKWADRRWLQQLKAQYPTDDILMVREGLITDTSYANVALWDGKQWLTPRLPLLAGTKRAQLIDQKILIPADIQTKDLQDFQYLKLINAMIDFEEAPLIAISDIR
ncbi:aminotransferase class IV [Rhodoflexus sp.]